MDEFLWDRLKQLKEIDERLEHLAVELCRAGSAPATLEQLRFDLRTWIDRAELEYAEF